MHYYCTEYIITKKVFTCQPPSCGHVFFSRNYHVCVCVCVCSGQATRVSPYSHIFTITARHLHRQPLTRASHRQRKSFYLNPPAAGLRLDAKKNEACVNLRFRTFIVLPFFAGLSCVRVCVPAKPHAFLHTHTSLARSRGVEMESLFKEKSECT